MDTSVKKGIGVILLGSLIAPMFLAQTGPSGKAVKVAAVSDCRAKAAAQGIQDKAKVDAYVAACAGGDSGDGGGSD